MVSSKAYPGLERKPGGPDNWVEAAAGLPDYIERIAKHLHYEKGMSISHAIATAVNTVKRWARGGTVTKNGTTKHITPATQAKAAAAVASWEAKKASTRGRRAVNLAEPDIGETQTMVALMLPESVSKQLDTGDGVETGDHHITLTFNGEVASDADLDEIVELVRTCAESYGPLSGTIGGIGAFPPGDQGTPWFVPADIPGINRLQLALVDKLKESASPAREDHSYTPHVTLTFSDEAQDPVDPIDVEFSSIWVVRGNERREEIPLGGGSSVDSTKHGTLYANGTSLSEAQVDVTALIERARSVSDPEAKARIRARILDLAGPPMAVRKQLAKEGKAIPGASSGGGFPIRNVEELKKAIRAIGRAKDPAKAKRHIMRRAAALGATDLIPSQWKTDLAEQVLAEVIDLALTRDGRKSFKRQGKWGHGFVPLDDKAKEAKAKGSPIARKRIDRLFSGAAGAKARRKAAQADAKSGVKVKGRGGGTRSAKTVAQTQGAILRPNKPTHLTKPKAQKEASRGRQVTRRTDRPWDTIAADQKTVRNGKRYVLQTFNGKSQLVEWQGQNAPDEVKTDRANKRYLTITDAQIKEFTSAELRRLLKVPGQPKAVRAKINHALRTASVKKKVAA